MTRGRPRKVPISNIDGLLPYEGKDKLPPGECRFEVRYHPGNPDRMELIEVKRSKYGIRRRLVRTFNSKRIEEKSLIEKFKRSELLRR